MAGKFELKQATSGQFHFNLLAGNGQVVLQSEMYDSKTAALNAIESIKNYTGIDNNYRRYESKSNKPYFVLVNDKNKPIGQSQIYESAAGRDNAIESVKQNSPNAVVMDLSPVDIKTKDTTTSKIGSFRTFFAELNKLAAEDDFLYFYRGHSDIRYELKPSIYRNIGWIENEDIIFRELILRCPAEFNKGETTFQNLVRMQHYSLPTRLLDLTSNPLIALYFATSENEFKTNDGEVKVFKIPKKEVKYFDSDTVSVIANLSKRKIDFEVPKEELTLEDFNNKKQMKFLLHEIRNEKPYFQPLIKKEHLESVIFVKPVLDNQRIIKQDGAFFLFGINGDKKQYAAIPERYLANLKTPLIINGDRKKHIRKQLKTMGVTQKAIFPEIENVANYIKNEFMI